MTENAPHTTPKQYALAIRRPVTMAMLFVTLLVFGMRSYQQLPINLMPDISYPTLTVRTLYEGAAPEEVEKLITRPLEEMLSVVSGMVEISSVSSAGRSDIILEFRWDTDMNVAQQELRDQLDLFEAPRDVTEKPVILRYDPALDPILRIALTPAPEDTPQSEEVMRQKLTAIRLAAERHLKNELEAKKGIAQAEIKGGRQEEIQVLADAVRLKSLGLSLEHVKSSLAQQNINLSGGRLLEGKTEYLVRTLNEFQTVAEIGETVITAAEGYVRLSDVAEVFLGMKEQDTIVRVNGQEAVGIDIRKEGGANTVKVCNTVKDVLGLERSVNILEQSMRAWKRALKAAEEVKKSEAVKEDPKKSRNLPVQTEAAIIYDQSRFINGAIREVQEAALLGGLLALLVLFLFLRELKATLVVGLAIPISVIATFVPMFVRDISLNVMSLGGLALGVGMLVDNAIVVLESIARCKEEGDGIVDAAERGTREVRSAVVASTLTTIAVFLPIAFVEGVAGQLFGDLALTVTFSLLASLLAALCLIPLIASRQALRFHAQGDGFWITRAYQENRDKGQPPFRAALRIPLHAPHCAFAALRQTMHECFDPAFARFARAKAQSRLRLLLFLALFLPLLPLLLLLFLCQISLQFAAVSLTTPLFLGSLALMAAWLTLRTMARVLLWLPLRLFDLGFDAFRRAYAFTLKYALTFSAPALLMVALISVHAGQTALNLGRELIPPMKQGEFGLRLEARPGTRLEETEAQAQRVATALSAHAAVDSVTIEIGQEDSDTSTERGENVAQFSILLKNPKQNAPRQDAIIEELRQLIPPRPGEDLSFTLPSLYTFKTAVEIQSMGAELDTLKEVGDYARTVVEGVPGLTDLELSLKPGYPEVIIELDREMLASRRITPEEVAARLRTEVQGEVATRFSRAGEKIDIRVRTNRALLNSVDDLRHLSVGSGVIPVPLAEVARIRQQEGPSEIRRIGQRQAVLLTGNVEGRDLGAVSNEIIAALSGLRLPEGCYFELGGQHRELAASYESLRFALLLALFLVHVVMACQFESIRHPALVMFSVPLAFIGVIYVLTWTQTALSIMVFLGGIMLTGIVVNDAIVLVDYINQLRRRGMPKREAILLAGQVRLRPILMTTVTTVLGLLPMVLSAGEGAELRRPMAVTVMAGLSSATILTLLIIPMAYHLFGGRDAPKKTGDGAP